ncbi:MAG: hypothetical protein IJN80_03220 [Clostridia bacterium]|nr:hypothetical protein [Clostridia bacterium]
MKNKLIKFGAVVMVMMIIASMLALPSSAYIAYNTYNYNYYGEAVETPSGYTPEKVYYGSDLGVGILNNPVDLYVSPQDEVYILDYVGNNNDAVLHIFDKNLKLIKSLSTLKANGHDYTMVLPESLVVDKYGYIYICDTGNKQILKLDKDKSGKIVQTIGAPNSDLFEGDFKPSKIAIAKNMSLYVISSGCLDGIMEFNEYGVFLRYFGAPDVQMTLNDLVNLAWRRAYRSLFGKGVDDSFLTYVPTEFENMVVDDYGFVYALMATTKDQNTDQLFKMNFLGSNILDPQAKSTKKVNSTLSATYGDLVRRATSGQGNIFVDVATDSDGFITMLDGNLKKIFEYDAEGNLTFVYGGDGQQQGFFSKPVAVAKLGKKTLVIDRYFGTLTVFDHTHYGEKLHNAIVLYDEGLYDEAEEYWDVVLKYNANCELAHIGLGKVYYQYGKYEEAINHFMLANDRKNYQDAYALYREALLSDHFGLIMTSLLVLIILWIVWRIFGKSIISAIKERKQGGGDDDDSEIME